MRLEIRVAIQLDLVDLLSVRQDLEALARRGAAQAIVQADEADAAHTLLAPDQGGGELQGIARTQWMDGQEPQGAGAHLFGRLDLEGARAQVVKGALGLPHLGPRERSVA